MNHRMSHTIRFFNPHFTLDKRLLNPVSMQWVLKVLVFSSDLPISFKKIIAMHYADIMILRGNFGQM